MKKLKIDYAPRPAPVAVELEFPLIVDGVEIAAVYLNPPSLAALARLSQRTASPPGALVAAVTGLRPAVVDALRWTDVESILGAARTVLPLELIEADDAGAEPVVATAADPDAYVRSAEPSPTSAGRASPPTRGRGADTAPLDSRGRPMVPVMIGDRPGWAPVIDEPPPADPALAAASPPEQTPDALADFFGLGPKGWE